MSPRAAVALHDAASFDEDGDALTYQWTQTDSPAVALSNSTVATPTFVTPPVGPGGTTLRFRLVVSDGLAESLPDDVRITVLHVNDPPSVPAT